jgi:hypothetical protein
MRRDAVPEISTDEAMSSLSTPSNSPFIVGIAHQDGLDATQTPRLVAEGVTLLRSLKEHLRHTDLRILLADESSLGTLLAQAGLELGISVEVVAASQSGPLTGDLAPDSPLAGLGADRLRVIDLPPIAESGAASLTASANDLLIRRSSLLLAFWDGEVSRSLGDTADTVARFLGVRAESSDSAKTFEIATVLEDADVTAQLVYWIPARRNDGGIAAESQPPCYLLSVADAVLDTKPSMPSSLKRRLVDLDEFNADFARLEASNRVEAAESLLRDLDADLARGDRAPLEGLDRQYVKADMLAAHMQRQSDRLFNLFAVMTFTMGLAYLIYDKVVESRFLLTVYLMILFASFLAYYAFQQKRWFGKHLAYRALAETLRVRFYLAVAGLDARMHTADLIALAGIHRFRGFSWIGFVLDAIEPTHALALQDERVYRRRGDFVERSWVETQYRYFLRKVGQMERDSHRVALLKQCMFAAALIDISAMFVFGDALHRIDTTTHMPVKNVLGFLCGFLAIVLGVWELRHNKMAMTELLWQYRNQLTQFAQARTRLKRTARRDVRDDLLIELGDNSLMETYLWALHRYHREHTPPKVH